MAFKESIWDVIYPVLSEWTGQELSHSSLYGIRIYKEGAVLAPHVDAFPLITAAILNVDQDGTGLLLVVVSPLFMWETPTDIHTQTISQSVFCFVFALSLSLSLSCVCWLVAYGFGCSLSLVCRRVPWMQW